MLFWIYFLLSLFGLFIGCSEGEYTVGVVGKIWYETFKRKLLERKEESLILLKEIELDEETTFYKNLMDNFQLINNQDINVLVGGTSLAMAQAAAHIGIPYFATDTKVHPSKLLEFSNMPHFYSVPLTDEIYSRAILDLICHFEVTKVAIIIDTTVNYEHFIRPLFDKKNINFITWTLKNEDTSDIGKLLVKVDKILEDSRDFGCWDFVVKADLSVIELIVSRAKHYGMLVRPNKWYFPSFVCHDINIPAIRQIYSNITLINEQCSESYLRQNSNYTIEAMINKVIQLFRMVDWKLTVNAFRQNLKNGKNKKFDEMGIQLQTKLTLHTLNVESDQSDELNFIGVWLYNSGSSQLSYLYGKKKEETSNIHLRVAAVEAHPHLIRLENGSLIGFGVDLISELSSLMNANFTITLSTNMGYKEGSNWTGVVQELLTNRADITLGPFVQSIEMEEVIDFSTSFKQREISLVMTAPSPSISLFQFIQPFSWSVWLLCLFSTVILTFVTWGIERVHDIYFENKLPVKLDFMESTWFTLGSVLKKQLDVFPNSLPALINNSSIFFFSLIIVTMYTANLAAFLTVQAYPNIIQEVEDLGRLPPKSEISFGTVKNSAILEFFRESDLDIFKKIYDLMAIKNPNWLVNSTAEGYKRALKGSYVFIWDDSVNQFEIFTELQYECKLIIVGRPFGKRSFAIGMQQNSAFREQINVKLLELLETGKVDNLLEKWWKAGSICGSMNTPNIEISPLSMSHVAGVFLIVVVGIFAAIMWFSVQLLVYHIKKRKTSRTLRVEDDTNIDNHEVPVLPYSNGMNEKFNDAV